MRRWLLLCSLLISTMACVGLLGGGCCGGGGGGGCGCGRKKRSADVEWAGQSGQHNDLLCNSAHLKNLINETISASPESSKLALMTRLQVEGENSAFYLTEQSVF